MGKSIKQILIPAATTLLGGALGTAFGAAASGTLSVESAAARIGGMVGGGLGFLAGRSATNKTQNVMTPTPTPAVAQPSLGPDPATKAAEEEAKKRRLDKYRTANTLLSQPPAETSVLTDSQGTKLGA